MSDRTAKDRDELMQRIEKACELVAEMGGSVVIAASCPTAGGAEWIECHRIGPLSAAVGLAEYAKQRYVEAILGYDGDPGPDDFVDLDDDDVDDLQMEGSD